MARLDGVEKLPRGRSHLVVKPVRLVVAKRSPFEDEVLPFSDPVDRLNRGIEPFQDVQAVHVGPLPTSLPVEMVNRRITEIERKRTRLETREDGLAGRGTQQ